MQSLRPTRHRLHWVLDVVFHDDLARLRTANGPHNMAIIKHIAMNLVRNPKDSHSLKNRRKLANLNQDYLAQLIRQKENQPETIPLDQGCPTNCRSNVAVAGRLKGESAKPIHMQKPSQHSAVCERIVEMQLIDPLHRGQIGGAGRMRQVAAPPADAELLSCRLTGRSS